MAMAEPRAENNLAAKRRRMPEMLELVAQGRQYKSAISLEARL